MSSQFSIFLSQLSLSLAGSLSLIGLFLLLLIGRRAIFRRLFQRLMRQQRQLLLFSVLAPGTPIMMFLVALLPLGFNSLSRILPLRLYPQRILPRPLLLVYQRQHWLVQSIVLLPLQLIQLLALLILRLLFALAFIVLVLAVVRILVELVPLMQLWFSQRL